MPRHIQNACVLFIGIVLCFGSRSVATFHTWDTNEIYSNADGTIQYIELIEADGLNVQSFLTGHHYTSISSDFEFGNDLPSTVTANRFFLMATAAFALLPGAVEPDYTIPDGFFSTGGDILTFRLADENSVGLDTFFFVLGQLPTNVFLSLGQGGPQLNSPTNFAGETGFIPEPAMLSLLALGAGTFMVNRRKLDEKAR